MYKNGFRYPLCMNEDHIDSFTLLNRVYESLSERATSLNGGISAHVNFFDIQGIVNEWKTDQESHDFGHILFDADPKPYNPEDVGIYSLIADDSDGHRTRQGFFKYRNGFIFPLKNTKWFISRGVPCGDYPANCYLGDISTVPVLTTLDDTIKQFSSSYFRNSLVVATTSGRSFGDSKLAFAESSMFFSFHEEIETILRAGVDETKNDYMKNPQYRPTIVPMMAQLLRQILERTPVSSVV